MCQSAVLQLVVGKYCLFLTLNKNQTHTTGPEGLSNLGLLRAGATIPAAAEAHPVPDISRRTGRNSHGAELMKYAQKVESFPSETPTVLVDIAASSRLPQGSSLDSHNGNVSVKI